MINQPNGVRGVGMVPQLRRRGGGWVFFLMIAVVLGWMWLNTQWTAEHFRFSRLLSTESMAPVAANAPPSHNYVPWGFFIWKARFEDARWLRTHGVDQARSARIAAYFDKQQWLLYSGAAGFWLAFIVLARVLRRRVDPVHGDAKFADRAEIKKSGLINDDPSGVVLTSWEDPKSGVAGMAGRKRVILRHNGNTHVICAIGTRGGKDRGHILPFMLQYPHSVVINDPKGASAALTMRARREELGNYVFRLALNDPDHSACWNPWDEIRIGTEYDVGDTLKISHGHVDRDGKGSEGKNAFFYIAAKNFLAAAALHVYYTTDYPHNGAGILAFLTDPTATIDNVVDVMLNGDHSMGGKYQWMNEDGAGVMTPSTTHPAIARLARQFKDLQGEERGSVLNTLMNGMQIYTLPIIARNTARSDFSIRQIANADRPCTVYFISEGGDDILLQGLKRLFFDLCFDRLQTGLKFENGRGKSPHRWPLEIILNEFFSFGKMPSVETGITTCAEYGIRVQVYVQTLDQVPALYGDKNSILPNMYTKIVGAAASYETAKAVSNLIGVGTIAYETQSTNERGRVSYSEHIVSKELLLPHHIMRLPQEQELVFHGSMNPIAGFKIYYDQVPLFARRSNLPILLQSDRLNHPRAKDLRKAGSPVEAA